MYLPSNDPIQTAYGMWLPMYFCVLNKDCIDPPGGALYCNQQFHINRKNMRTGQSFEGSCENAPPDHKDDCECGAACHRFDQSLTNLAAGNYYKFDKKLYTIRGLLYDSGEIKHGEMSGWQHVDDVTDLKRG